jgi:hypothetical protein
VLVRLHGPDAVLEQPSQGQTITGRSHTVTVSSSDDHAVRKIDLYMDDGTIPVSSTTCDDVTYICQLDYSWLVGAPGQHTARFESTERTGHVGVLTVTFYVCWPTLGCSEPVVLEDNGGRRTGPRSLS